MPPSALNTAEPIAGYKLKERIGAGGYGEVWAADAPGGLTKAVKFIFGCLDDQRAACELKALNRIKEVRHPFLLSLERIEVVDGQLIIVTELAESSLKDRWQQCRQEGKAGIPRDELLVYLRDAADALDYMSENFALQHLDVKPENLLIVGGRVKVADFGLVKDIDAPAVSLAGGLTPVYAPPEVFDGQPCLHSDQYSLAIVFQELLTGVLPFPGKTAAQLMAQHLHNRPQLGPLEPADRPIIARALAKNPKHRFPNCREMIDNLLHPPESTVSGRSPGGGDRLSGPDSQGDGAGSQAAESPAVSPRGNVKDQPRPFGGGNLSPTDGMGEGATPALKTLALGEGLFGAEGLALEGQAGLEELEPEEPEVGTLTRLRMELPDAAPDMVDLPPIELNANESRLHPTLILGIGGMAARTLWRLRRRLNDRLGPLESIPALQMLLVDTDRKTIADATRSEQAAALDPHDVLAMPLRQRQDYRADSGQLLKWLSRRWLYNIPRSLQTEGLRPLGRLALVDHIGELLERVRAAVTAMTDPEALAVSAEKTGLSPGPLDPRVFIVSSISGGTGSGMVIDVAYAVRKVLADLGHARPAVCGILTHSTGRNPDARDLAIANTCSCLTELHHYHCTGRYPGDPACGLPAFDDGTPTFDDAYLIHLGNELDEEQFDSATDMLAEYLYLDTVTAGGEFFRACREAERTDSQPPRKDLHLRTFGLCQIGYSQSSIPWSAAEVLCRKVVDRWRGDVDSTKLSDATTLSQVQSSTQPTETPSPVDAEGIEGEPPAELQLDIDDLVRQVGELAARQLGGDADAFFSKALDRCFAHHDAQQAVEPGRAELDAARGPLAVQILNTIDDVLGSSKSGDDLSTSGGRFVRGEALLKGPAAGLLQRTLYTKVKELASAQSKIICAWLLELVDTSATRVKGAQHFAHWVAERLKVLEAKGDGIRQNLRIALNRSEEALLEPEPPDQARPKGWLGIGRARRDSSELYQRWQKYFRLRLDQIVLQGTCLLLRSLQPGVSAVGDRLNDLSRELNLLVDAFDVYSSPCDREVEDGVLSSTLRELQTSVAETLRSCMPELASHLDEEFQKKFLGKHGGLRGVLEYDIDLRGSFADRLRSAARSAVFRALKQINIAKVLFPPQEESSQSPRPLRACLDAATPRLSTPGAARRLLLVCPKDSIDEPVHAAVEKGAGQAPSVVFDSDGDLILCYEVQHLSLARIAANLIDNRSDYAQIASRLHTRVDVNWSPLFELD